MRHNLRIIICALLRTLTKKRGNSSKSTRINPSFADADSRLHREGLRFESVITHQYFRHISVVLFLYQKSFAHFLRSIIFISLLCLTACKDRESLPWSSYKPEHVGQ